ncbi:hypothetical protein HOY80DRAFT_993671 [Tuber brumale]|nr:hypothetical protein HOY80DRAFT_993671 [Tuber brumale]
MKDKAEGPFVNDWKKIFPAEIEGVEEFDVSSAISQCLAIKDDLELVSRTVQTQELGVSNGIRKLKSRRRSMTTSFSERKG